jgi:hypothetical protein
VHLHFTRHSDHDLEGRTMTKKSSISRVARGTTGEVVDAARRQIFSPVDKIGPVPAGVPRRSLQQVLCELLESEINVGLQTFAFDSFRVWFGDELNGIHAQAELKPGGPAWRDDAAIAHWLHETAIRLYPQSKYAKRCQ